jgi:hypothetical protein
VHWTRLAIIVVATGLVSSMTDWFFAGDWIHRRFTYPEIWRTGSETKAIMASSALPFLTCGVFAYLLVWMGMHSLAFTVPIAVAVWLIGPLPLILTNAAFIKLHRVFVLSYATGWLVKLVLVAVAVGWFIR